MTEDLRRPTDHQRESGNPGFDDHSVWDLPGRGALGAADDKMIGNRLDGDGVSLLLLLMVIGGNCRKEAQGTSEARPPNFNSPLDGCFTTHSGHVSFYVGPWFPSGHTTD